MVSILISIYGTKVGKIFLSNNTISKIFMSTQRDF
nr:MAG TPA: hypothetical protein [Crassvirales sp.]